MRDGQLPPAVSAATRARAAQTATWISVAVNLALTVAQLIIGWMAHSQSLIAHGLHSFSDLLSDFLVIWASRQSAVPADRAHPYGHARVETAATLVLGTSLILIGAGIVWDSGWRLQAGNEAPTVGMLAFWTAVLTVLAKEGLYRYLIAVARRLRSQLLTANALHTRADAASALVVVVGIGGALLGWGFLDLLAAALMGFMILRMGAMLAWDSIKELIDTGLDETQLAAIRNSLLNTPGVLGLHELRTRRMAHQVLVDAHVQVEPWISVSEGHRIAELARARVLDQHPEVLDVLVHVDPDGEAASDQAVADLPGREELMPLIDARIADLPRPERVVLHYIAGAIDVEFHFAAGAMPEQDIAPTLKERLQALPMVRKLRVNRVDAP